WDLHVVYRAVPEMGKSGPPWRSRQSSDPRAGAAAVQVQTEFRPRAAHVRDDAPAATPGHRNYTRDVRILLQQPFPGLLDYDKDPQIRSYRLEQGKGRRGEHGISHRPQADDNRRGAGGQPRENHSSILASSISMIGMSSLIG